MALTKFTGAADVISQLSDQPNDNDGLSAQQLKAKFDQFGETFKTYLNDTLIPELEAAISSAAAGIPLTGLSGASLVDNSVPTEKLSHTTGYEAVSTNNVRDKAITKAKLSQALQNTIDGLSAVASSGSYNDLTDRPVIDDAMSENSTNAVQNQVVNTALGLKQNQHTTQQVTLAANATSWTVSCTGVTADNTVFARADPEYAAAESRYFIRCTGQGAGTLTFTAASAPADDIVMNVVIFD